MTTKIEQAIEEIRLQLSALLIKGDEMQNKVNELYNVVVTGSENKPSLRAQVARHDDWINNANRLIWILVTAIVGQALVSVCAFLVWIITFLGINGAFGK